MKRLLSVALVVVMLLSLASCSLFNDDSIVKFGETYTHKDPDGLAYDERKALFTEDFGATLVEMSSEDAMPDTMKYDEDGNIIGMWNDYDPTTGLASSWTNFETMETVEEVGDLGKPDESLMLQFKGNIDVAAVVYGKDGVAVRAFLYIFLADAADKDACIDAMKTYYEVDMTSESDKVLVLDKDAAGIEADLTAYAELLGAEVTDKSATGYADLLKMTYGLKFYGFNPYAPCSAAVDPEGLDFDSKIVITSNGAYSFMTEYASLEENMKGRTDIIYGKDGKAIAHYTYYEFNDKAAADQLFEVADKALTAAERVSDTVVMDKYVGQTFDEIITSYIGYNVLKSDSIEDYATMVEETYLGMRYEE